MDPDAKPAGPPAEPAWDTEGRNDLLPKTAHLRDTTMYLSAPLIALMEAEWQCTLTHIKTHTDDRNCEVLIGRAATGEPGAQHLRRLGSDGYAAFSFWIPLKKLHMKVPDRRQFNFEPRLRRINDNLSVFVVVILYRRCSPYSPHIVDPEAPPVETIK